MNGIRIEHVEKRGGVEIGLSVVAMGATKEIVAGCRVILKVLERLYP